ncbi:catechol 2,3-dioxygenase [Actinomadura sp. NBRC 104412]|uniref:VOC family protein n=1 Tax=Actinomadura sp. NBRC 104412 TaxID=3032203 RepID=UPI00249FEEC0|nr:VOC family protein [Actinomadura sp. NBRC 104412]GLZ02696.1 catechol 2,3-dioxygenase [Actinomadura sp. NBRC 104412]
MTAPWGDIAHLGHVELLTPDLDGTVWFFTDILGLVETGREGSSVHLRTFDDYELTSLIVTGHSTSGIRRTAFRAGGPEALERRAEAIRAAGHEGTWVKGDAGTGRTFLTTDPDGHELALYFETERYQAPDDLRPGLKNQPQAKPNRGIGVRRLDHVNYLAADVLECAEYMQNLLGAKPTEQIRMDSGRIAARWMTFTNKSYDVVYTEDWTGSNGRLHHIAFATDTREEILRAADLCLDKGVHIETGPHKHAIQQTFFLYVWEPGGNRIELCNPLTRLVLAPDWELITWTEEERKKGQAWGLKTIETFHTHGTPPVGE